MNEQLVNALAEAQQPFADTRFNVCRLEIVERTITIAWKARCSMKQR